MDKKLEILEKHKILSQSADIEKPFQLNLSRDGHIGTVRRILLAMDEYARFVCNPTHTGGRELIYVNISPPKNKNKAQPINGIMPQYEMHDGIPIAVIFRTKETGQTEPCPFCGLSHKHGIPDGHRVAHCVTIHHKGKLIIPTDIIQTSDGKTLLRENGYMVRTVSDIKNSIFAK